MADPIIKIENMNKWFGDFQVLKDVGNSASKDAGVCSTSPAVLIGCVTNALAKSVTVK